MWILKPSYTHLIALVLAAALLTACTTTIPHSKTHKRGPRIYQVNVSKPFTGIVIGKGRESYHSRRLSYEKSYVDGLQEGFTKYRYDNGKLESVVPYKKGKISGVVIRYYSNGKKRSKIHYVGGLRGGDKGEIFWSRDGKVIRG